MKCNILNFSDLYLEDNKLGISEYLKNMLNSQNVEIDKSKKIENMLNSLYVRSYFAKCLYQEKFNQNKLHILNDRGFDDLISIIFNSLVLSNNESSQFDNIRLITKSCFFYLK